MKIDEIFEGEWTSESEYLIRCPFCGDHPTHNHCSINLEKKCFHCFYCSESGSIYKLIGEGIDIDSEPRQGITKKKEYEELDLSSFKKITGLNNANDRLAMSYLKKRGLDKNEIEQYDIRYCPDSFNKYYGRVIFPIIEDGRIVCFSARSFLGFVKPKYLFPHEGETICTAGEVIFGYERFKNSKSKNVILIEGIFDAIAINQKTENQTHGLALLNSDMTAGQLKKFRKLYAKFYIMLDADAKEKSLKIADKLFHCGHQVYIAFLKHGDPASNTSKEIDTAIKEAKVFNYDLNLKDVLEMEMEISGKEF